MTSPSSFGQKFYWKTGLFGVLLGFIELSFVKNLHRLDQNKQELVEGAEHQLQKLKENDKVLEAKEKAIEAKERFKESKLFNKLKDKVDANEKVKSRFDALK